MRIFNNVSALIAVNQMNKNTALQGNSMKKLSTGLRINKAGDDAAGIAISEGMRAKIRGLDQGTKNVQDGISLVQTTEGAMEEIQNIVGRIDELAIQSANGTLTDSDREKINVEVNQLKQEIQDITDNTNFNGIPLLQGPEVNGTNNNASSGGNLPSWIVLPNPQELSNASPLDPPPYGNVDLPPGNYAQAVIDFSAFDGSAKKINEILDQGFFSTCCTCTDRYNIRFTDKDEPHESIPGTPDIFIININISDIVTPEALVREIVKQTETVMADGKPYHHYTQYMVDPKDPKKLIIYDRRQNYNPTPASGEGVLGQYVIQNQPVDVNEYIEGLNIQYGSDAGQSKEIIQPNTSLKSLGMTYVDLSTQESARESIVILREAQEYLSSQRAKMGAYDNMLEVKSNVNTTHTENLTSAESRIRDVDIAKEMIKLSKINIITQASQSMIAQAKQQPQGIMNLLN